MSLEELIMHIFDKYLHIAALLDDREDFWHFLTRSYRETRLEHVLLIRDGSVGVQKMENVYIGRRHIVSTGTTLHISTTGHIYRIVPDIDTISSRRQVERLLRRTAWSRYLHMAVAADLDHAVTFLILREDCELPRELYHLLDMLFRRGKNKKYGRTSMTHYASAEIDEKNMLKNRRLEKLLSDLCQILDRTGQIVAMLI